MSIGKGKKTPYAGVLMDNERANKVRHELLEKDSLKKLNESYRKSMKYLEENSEFLETKTNGLMDRNNKLATELSKTRSTSTFTKVLYFLGGVVVMGAAVHFGTKLK